MSLAIGKRGQNVRLASKLCGWDIEIMTRDELDEQIERFLAALAEGEARLAQASRSRDYTTLGDAAHYLLSQAKLVGSTPLVEAAVSLERAARAKDGFAFGELLLRVHREVRSVTAAMRRYHPAGQSA